MPFSIRLPQKDGPLLLILSLVYTITRLPLMFYLPFVKDESLYSIMIAEQAKGFTLIPTFLGEAVNWKPALFFWVYSLFPRLPDLFPIEASFRYPSFIFGLLTVPLVFYTLKNAGANRNIAFFTCLIFLLSLPSIYPNGALLLDTLDFFLISLALCLYTSAGRGKKAGEGGMDGWRFLAAGALVFAAFFVKLILCFMVPILAVAYFFWHDRKVLVNPAFLLSLLAAPAALLANAWLLQSAGMGSDLSVSVVGEHPALHEAARQIGSMTGSVDILLRGAGIWFALSLFGFVRHWKENRFMALWYLLIIFPLVTGYYMVWYYLPVMPAVAFFSALILIRWEGGDRLDLFFALFFSVAVAITLGLSGMYYTHFYEWFSPERDTGNALIGKDNVMVIGAYTPGIVAYKALGEMDEYGRPKDFGWVIIDPEDHPPGSVETFIADYHTSEIPVSSEFNSLFKSNLTFRKSTHISKFDYFTLVYLVGEGPANATLIYNNTNITIYRAG